MSEMYSGWVPQKEVVLPGNIVIGGLPGLKPLLMVGSVFYIGDKCLGREGIDRSCVEEKYSRAVEAADKYGLKLGVDLIVPDKSLAEQIVDTIDLFSPPVFLDVPDEDARTLVYKMVKEKDLGDRIVANGIDPYTGEELLRLMRDAGIDSAVLLLFDPKNPTGSLRPHDRLDLLEEKLLPLVMKYGFKNLLVDAIVLDPASIALSSETIFLVKKKHGLPSGCAPANSIGVISRKKHGSQTYYSVNAAVIAYLRTMGADYIMYGPMKRLETLAEAAATIDSLLAYNHLQEGKRIPRSHPLRKYWKNIQRLFTSQ
ncbi:MAG: tetrahydromethanopterin S-methyltransferase subunit H [Crenarchaeota archaeon]|nr:tetrahydromethanopterin S-methyltransferase subunit H [Thermoproteota archaeon]